MESHSEIEFVQLLVKRLTYSHSCRDISCHKLDTPLFLNMLQFLFICISFAQLKLYSSEIEFEFSRGCNDQWTALLRGFFMKLRNRVDFLSLLDFFQGERALNFCSNALESVESIVAKTRKPYHAVQVKAFFESLWFKRRFRLRHLCHLHGEFNQ